MATGIAFGWQVENASGVPVSGAKVYFYVPGTSTPRTPYTDSGLTVPSANPVIADASGYFLIYLSSELAYDIVIKSADDSITYQERKVASNISGAQPVDPTLTALAGLTVADGDFIRATGADTFETLSTEEVTPRQTLESFGAVGDGSTDDYAALVLALAAGVPLAGKPGATYRYVGRLLAPAYFNLDGQGCTFKPVYAAASGDTLGQRYGIYSTLQTFGAINTVSVQTAGTREVTLSTTPSEISVGDIIGFFGTSLDGRWPITYRTVTAINTNDVTFDQIIPYAIGGTVTCRRIVFNSEFTLKNCTIDCTNLDDGTAELDGVTRTLSYRKRVLENVVFTNLDINQSGTDYIINTDYCLDVETRGCKAENAIRNGSFESVFRARSYWADGNTYSGDGFGIAPVNCDSFWIEDNEISGQYAEDPGGSLSVRGIRPIGCLDGEITGNTVTDIDSGIKLEDCANITVTDNKVNYCNTAINFSDQQPSARSGGHVITGNIIKEYLGNGIALGTTATGDGLWQPVTCSHNRVMTSNASASQPILVRGGTIISEGNIITDWPSGQAPFQTATADGQTTKGILSSLYALAGTTSGRLGVTIDASHTGLQIDHNRVVCNAPAGKFAALPPRTEVAYGPIFQGTVDLASTSDQTLNIVLPDGFTRYRAVAAHITNDSAADASAAVGGIYTAASKGGSQLVANTQVHSALTAQNTDQAITINLTVANGVMTDLELFYSLTTPSSNAATGRLVIMGYWVP